MAEVHDRIRQWWDRDSSTYDRSPSHAMTDPVEAAAWRAAMVRFLPPPGARVLDVGAGTGAMSLLAAQLGYQVTALDISPGMLEKAREKAEQLALDVEFVLGPSSEPPAGPFDAVMERHVLWTTPDPVGAMRAWRGVAPEGRLILFEGTWGGDGGLHHLRELAVDLLRGALRISHDHHAPYDPEILEETPLARTTSPQPYVDAVAAAGWRNVRLHGMGDVEWARRISAPLLLGWLEHVPRYALVADA